MRCLDVWQKGNSGKVFRKCLCAKVRRCQRKNQFDFIGFDMIWFDCFDAAERLWPCKTIKLRMQISNPIQYLFLSLSLSLFAVFMHAHRDEHALCVLENNNSIEFSIWMQNFIHCLENIVCECEPNCSFFFSSPSQRLLYLLLLLRFSLV